MKFLINILKKRIRIGSVFGSTAYELEMFACGIGKAEIKEQSIRISQYPFEASTFYPDREVSFNEIDEIHLSQSPLTIKVADELIFISKEHEEELKAFAKRNNLVNTKRNSNWDWITEPFLDTEFEDDQKEATTNILKERGISKKELKSIREEVEKQMYKYNFDTYLWEWCNLGLPDVLIAMRSKLNKEAFTNFYWRAMEIELRNNKINK